MSCRKHCTFCYVASKNIEFSSHCHAFDKQYPWTARRSNQSILKEINPGISLEGMMLKLKLQYFGHLMQRGRLIGKDWCWEGLGAGGEGADRGWDGWMASLTRWTWVWVNSGTWWWTGVLACCDSWGDKESDTTEQLNWTDDLLWGDRRKQHMSGRKEEGTASLFPLGKQVSLNLTSSWKVTR